MAAEITTATSENVSYSGEQRLGVINCERHSDSNKNGGDDAEK